MNLLDCWAPKILFSRLREHKILDTLRNVGYEHTYGLFFGQWPLASMLRRFGELFIYYIELEDSGLLCCISIYQILGTEALVFYANIVFFFQGSRESGYNESQLSNMVLL